MNTSHEEAFLRLLNGKLGSQILESSVNLGFPEVRVDRKSALDLFKILKLDAELKFDLFLSVTAVDWMDQREDRFEMVYHILSTKTWNRLRVKISVPESDPEVPSVSNLWLGSNFMEREVFDMYGIKFKGHSDLRRTLLYDEFVGHPLRKDYPIQAKQPRVPLRYPEVRNTAVDMKRPSLIAINSKKKVA